MDVLSRVRTIAWRAVPDFTTRERLLLPSWLLLPGLIALAVSAAFYLVEVHYHPVHGSDLKMYWSAAHAVRAGTPIYGVRWNDNLPFTSPPAMAIVMLPTTFFTHATLKTASLVFGVVGTFIALLCATRMLSHRGMAGRVGLAAGVTALALWTEPFQNNFLNGQINVILLLLILGDLAQSDRSRFKGAGVGVAAAMKLIPALFVVYLLLTRRLRAAATAVGAFAVLTAVGWIVEPGASVTFWFNGGLSSRSVVNDPQFAGEQALQGTVARFLRIDTVDSLAWICAVAVVGIAGLALATWAQRSGFEGMGVVVTGLVALMVSPGSWSHYWVWIAPLVLVLIDIAARTHGRARTLVAGLPALAVMPFLAWHLNKPELGPMLPIGLIWTVHWKSPTVGMLATDSYAITSLVVFVLMALWLYSRRKEATALPVPQVAERESPVLGASAVQAADR
jgi:alpha-1,2-mannosyltransferase